jgi:hypothetical protein
MTIDVGDGITVHPSCRAIPTSGISTGKTQFTSSNFIASATFFPAVWLTVIPPLKTHDSMRSPLPDTFTMAPLAEFPKKLQDTSVGRALFGLLLDWTIDRPLQPTKVQNDISQRAVSFPPASAVNALPSPDSDDRRHWEKFSLR